MFFILILFMVSVDTWFNENLLLILNFYYCFYTLVTNYLIMKLIASFPNDIEVSSAQLKRLDESVVDPKCLLKVSVTSFCFDKNSSFSSNIFSCILLFLFERYGLYAFENGLELPSTLFFLKVQQFGLFIQICHRVLLWLKLENVIRIFWLVWIVFESDLIIICSRRFRRLFDSFVIFFMFI